MEFNSLEYKFIHSISVWEADSLSVEKFEPSELKLDFYFYKIGMKDCYSFLVLSDQTSLVAAFSLRNSNSLGP